jgi:hypothetical protein
MNNLVIIYTIILVVVSNPKCGLAIMIKKCCATNQVLDPVNIQCVPKSAKLTQLTSFMPSYMLNLTSNDANLGQSLITMSSIIKESDSAKNVHTGQMVSCNRQTGKAGQQKRMVLDMTKPLEYLITTNGELVSLAGQFDVSEPLGDFCIGMYH